MARLTHPINEKCKSNCDPYELKGAEACYRCQTWLDESRRIKKVEKDYLEKEIRYGVQTSRMSNDKKQTKLFDRRRDGQYTYN